MYAPVGPYREDLLPYQRATYDFFMPEKLRNELQRKAFATLQVMPSELARPLERCILTLKDVADLARHAAHHT
jgi:PAB-dependent poly(A)-specific ribonuclease subunit 3